MTDAPASASFSERFALLRRALSAFLRNRPSDEMGRTLFGVAYVVAFLIAGAAVWLVAVAPDAGWPTASGARSGVGGEAGRLLFSLLLLNLVLILGLAAVIGARVLALVRARRAAGSRLHLRFVALFSLVAVAPAILVALVFGVLINRGVDQWFSENVKTAVDNGADIGKAYIRDVAANMDADLVIIADQLEDARPLFPDRVRFSDALGQVADIFGYPAAYVLNSRGEVLAAAEGPNAPPYVAPSLFALQEAAETGQPSQQVNPDPDAVLALTALHGYGDAFLYLVRPLQPGLVSQLAAADQSIQSYRVAQESRARIQASFALSYLETALLVLLGAVWLGMSAANAISRPVGRLVTAAEQAAGGDLSTRVDGADEPGEIGLLARAFNRMTEDLEVQQGALKAASDEAIDRTRFIETVLSGVSAGVIGLDRRGRISAINDSAVELLAIGEAELIGRQLAKVSPELSELVSRAEAHIEEDIDVARDGETRRLRVRIEGGQGGEMVLTFDDITRLVTAQRNAAWRDVARRIAHEIKNPLTPIQLSAERLKRRYRSQVKDDVEVFDRCTDTIIRQVGDIGRMVDEFSAFARMPAPRFGPEDPAELLRQAVFAQRVAAPDVDVKLEAKLPRARLLCDGRMVGQALANILKNAGESVMARRAADGGGGALAISARLEIADDTALFIIEDDGVGLPEKDRDRLVEPYVTTRERGTGLGLAIVKRICEDHGGDLLLSDAEELSGARITLVFPLDPTTVAPASPGAASGVQ